MRLWKAMCFGLVLAGAAYWGEKKFSTVPQGTVSFSSQSLPQDLMMTQPPSAPQLLINSAKFGFPYAYGPSMIFANGIYYAYFCSTGTGSVDWDHVRMAMSSNLTEWSAPTNVLTSTPVERANCDPSLTFFDAGDGPFYYMVYSGNAVNVQTLNFVARATSPAGPFLKYTDRGTWEENPKDPHAINWPLNRNPDVPPKGQPSVYGLGQPSLVVKNGRVYQWFNDTTKTPGQSINQIYLVTSTNLVNWTPPAITTATSPSIDVKYDEISDNFVMFEILDEHTPNSRLSVRVSKDGLQWSDSQVICDANCFPHWSNNVGASGDNQGHLLGGEVMVAYGAPYGLNPAYNNDCNVSKAPLCWGNWDLYGTLLHFTRPEPKNPGEASIYRVYKKSSGEHFFTADVVEGLNAGYDYEQVGFHVWPEPGTGRVGIYRCLIPGNGFHFTSTSSTCEGQRVEGLYGYIYSQPGPGRQGLYRLRNQKNDHLTTLNQNEGTNSGYVVEGLIGYSN